MITETALVNNTKTTIGSRKLIRKTALFFSPLCCLLFLSKTNAQDINAPRFFEFNIQPTAASPITNAAQFQPGISPQTQPNYRIQAALRFPIKMKGNTKIIGELKHKNDFVNGYYALDDNHYKQLELSQSKGTVMLFSQLNEKWKFTNALSVSSNSTDFISTNANTMQFRNISLFEKEMKSGATIGFGSSITYDRNLTFIPIFKYETDFGNGWNLNMVLPKEIEVSKSLNKNSRLLFEAKGSGANYTLGSREVLNDLTATSIYKRLDVTGTVGYERQITPWIGFALKAGAIAPLGSGIYANDKNQMALYKFKGGVSPYFNVGVFMSFPK